MPDGAQIPAPPGAYQLNFIEYIVGYNPDFCPVEERSGLLPKVIPIFVLCYNDHSVSCVTHLEHSQLDRLIDWPEVYTSR